MFHRELNAHLTDVPPESGEAGEFFGGGEVSALGKDVVAVGGDAVEDGAVKVGGGSDGEASVRREQFDAVPCFGI